ncbi:DUF4838 domain-containing protein [Paenibacillus eucommiae]|uniref:DUF4838 domain-containing protein n=1 Tax=Paenibacillus eucommiae TaxID=1355755 RepID=A0ABS4IUY2_9BACL|nr:DUF4838 domain-containing protein [Paenibacillus eucommiae]MBP1990671.1 hypothetical protein [Paenibacillus eucommiae]
MKQMNGFTLVDNGIGRAAIVAMGAGRALEAIEAMKAGEPGEAGGAGGARSAVNAAALANEHVRSSAELLVYYIQLATGAELPILAEGDIPNARAEYDAIIFVGLGSLLFDGVQDSLNSMNDEGFVIQTQDKAILIAGNSSWGTMHGVCEFLEQYVGVRWLMPGPDGEDVPASPTLWIPHIELRQQPAFMSRTFSPLKFADNMNGPLHYEWALRNRLPYRFNAHHNMSVLFSPEKYGETHPEFYPMREGKRYIPPVEINYEWQPDFSNPATVQAAIETIVQYFDGNPQQSCYSLGINDSSGYCEEDPDHPHYTSKLNSKGFVDMSDIYYKWVNQVAEGVLQVHPDKWFGLLAYENVIDPPSFPLHPRVVPVITKDRMTWIDPDVAAGDQLRLQEWQKTAASTGWYDYIYGSPYMVPRMYLHQMADNYRYAQQNKVSVQYAELYPNWGEGPKPWVTAKLLWDPNADVDALVSEWLERAVGVQAAPYLAAYYSHWEHFWTKRIQDSTWFQEGKNLIYLLFPDAKYLELISEEEMTESKELLEAALAHAGTHKQQIRAQMLLNAFEYYESCVLSYPKTIAPITDASTALSLLQHGAITRKVELAQKRLQLAEALDNDPILKHPLSIQRFASYGFIWSGWNPSLFWRLKDYISENEHHQAGEQSGGLVFEKVKELARAADTNTLANKSADKMVEFSQVLLNAVAKSAPLWQYDANSQGHITIASNVPSINPAAFFVNNENHPGEGHCLVIHPVSLQTGLLAGRAAYYSPPGTSKGTAEMALHGLNAEGEAVFKTRSAKKQLAATAGDWSSLELFEDVSALASLTSLPNLASVTQIQVLIKVSSLAEDTVLSLGDIGLYQAALQ